jgi:hypothetical protein
VDDDNTLDHATASRVNLASCRDAARPERQRVSGRIPRGWYETFCEWTNRREQRSLTRYSRA